MKNIIAIFFLAIILTACGSTQSRGTQQNSNQITLLPNVKQFNDPTIGVRFSYPSSMEIDDGKTGSSDTVKIVFYSFKGVDGDKSFFDLVNISQTDGKKQNSEIFPVDEKDYKKYLIEEITTIENSFNTQESMEILQKSIDNAKFFRISNYDAIDIKVEITQSGFPLFIRSAMVITETRTVFLYYLSVYLENENRDEQAIQKEMKWQNIISSMMLDY